MVGFKVMKPDSPEPDADSPEEGEATRLLRAISAEGGGGDTSRLLEIVYDTLRRLAGDFLRRERADHTLQPTALVNEAWMKLVRQDEFEWQDRAHFLSVAAQAMRRILVDHARTKNRVKRGGGWKKVDIEAGVDGVMPQQPDEPELDLVALDEALVRLRGSNERAARVVELRFFGGLENQAVAHVLDVSERTVERDWRYARAFLSDALRQE